MHTHRHAYQQVMNEVISVLN